MGFFGDAQNVRALSLPDWVDAISNLCLCFQALGDTEPLEYDFDLYDVVKIPYLFPDFMAMGLDPLVEGAFIDTVELGKLLGAARLGLDMLFGHA